jgi:hypothetical protein
LIVNVYKYFAKDFIERYKLIGFGLMNKNDFEVLIFDLFKSYGNLKYKSNSEVSIILQLTESKIRRFVYETELK